MPGNASAGEFKMVLVVRGELRLTAGKAAVQVAHAAVDLVELCRSRYPRELDAWRAAGQKKIAVVSPTLSAMEDLRRRAQGLKLPTVLIQDAGLTEVPPGTATVLGIGPARSSVVDPLTGSLPLL